MYGDTPEKKISPKGHKKSPKGSPKQSPKQSPKHTQKQSPPTKDKEEVRKTKTKLPQKKMWLLIILSLIIFIIEPIEFREREKTG